MSIEEIRGKINPSTMLRIKGLLEDNDTDFSHTLFVAIALVLVGTASFGLGRLSQKESITPYIELSQNVASVGVATPENPDANLPTGAVVASKKGSKYHYPWCSGARTIAPENKITFASIEEARAAGYTPAANCKGLE